jgi:heterodisulfide reductase subunit A-like polyferredoxin
MEKNDWTHDELVKEVDSHTAVIIPANIRIEAQQRILDLSGMKRLLKDAKLIALGECYCRKKYQKCDGPIDVCLNLDKEAEDFIAKGLAEKVNLDTALGALKRSHEAGLVHIAYTFKGKEKPEVICSCCSCCCHSMSALVRFGMLNAVVESKYVATNNSETCVNCGTCVERCQFKARQMKNGKLFLNGSRCFGCGLCITTCPTQTISLTQRV